VNEADDPGRTGPSSCFIFYFSPLLSLSTIIVIMKKAIHSKSVSCGTHAPIAQQQTPPSPILHGQMFIHWSYSMPPHSPAILYTYSQVSPPSL
jgi:hypothetical protein